MDSELISFFISAISTQAIQLSLDASVPTLAILITMSRSSSRSRSPPRFDSENEANEALPLETAAETVSMSELWNMFVNQLKVAEEGGGTSRG